MRRSIRRLVSLTAVVTLLFQPYAFASKGFDPQNLDVQKLEEDLAEFSVEEKPKLEAGMLAWSGKQEELVPHLLAAAERLEAEANRIMFTRGKEYLTELINTNHFIVEDPGTGISMEYRLIDGHRVPRILINDEVYIIVDEKIISRDSKHLQQYIARTHHESGQNRVQIDHEGQTQKTFFGNNKTIWGRNLTIVFLNDDVTEVKKLAKPKPTQWKWWKEYFVSKYKKPTMEDFSMALVTGVAMQGTLALGATALKSNLLGTEFSMIPTYWTMAFGLGVGTIISTYRNWAVNSGTRLTRVLKSQTLSSLYAVGLVLAVSDGSVGDRLSTISLFTTDGQAKNVSILANGMMNNYAKDHWNQIPRIRESTRQNAKLISFRVPFTNRILDWKQSSLESQMLYMVPWTINVISLMTLASTDWFQIPGTSITIPILQFAGIPIAMYWSKWYSRHLANKFKDDPDAQVRARELEEMASAHESIWESSFGMKIREIPGKLTVWLNTAADSTKTGAQKCLNYLKGPV